MTYIKTEKGIEKFTDEQVEILEAGRKADIIKNMPKKDKIAKEKGSVQEQLDYIVKNGIEAYIAEMTRIEGETE